MNLSSQTNKKDIFDQIAIYMKSLGLTYTEIDDQRPWGGFYVIEETQTATFIHEFYKDHDFTAIIQSGQKLSPKILIIQPGEMLSWQWHERRGELWNLIAGQAGYKANSTDEEPSQVHQLRKGITETIPQGTRHRLVGSTQLPAEWGIVAEIWSHTDLSNPSNEEDNHRLKDKYSRT